MKPLIKSALIALPLFLASVAAHADYRVDTKLYQAGQLVGAPSMVVKANKPATVSVNSTYDIELMLEPYDSQQVRVTATVNLHGIPMRPTLLVELGKPNSLTIGDRRMEVVVNKSQ